VTKTRAAIATCAATFVLLSSSAWAGSCAQPVSSGNAPVAGDCLYILRTAVGISLCEPCVCDANGSGQTTAGDALLCLKDAVGQPVTLDCPACCAPPLAPQESDFTGTFLSSLDASHDFSVPASCDTSTTVCCTGGDPISPCGPVHVDMLSASFTIAPSQTQVNLTLHFRLQTVEDIPFTVPNVGNCFLGIDTTPGPTSTMSLEVPLTLADDGVTVMSYGSFTIGDLTADDFTISGASGCQFTNVALDFYFNHLQQILDDRFAPMIGLCLGTP